MFVILVSKALRLARVNDGSHSFTCVHAMIQCTGSRTPCTITFSVGFCTLSVW